jgi:hypothetical protein
MLDSGNFDARLGCGAVCGYDRQCAGTEERVVSRYRPGARAAGLLISLAVVNLAACGGGGGDASDKVSAASLKSRLLPVSVLPGFRHQRTFDWSDPVNLVGQGLPLPETIQPSSAVKTFEDAGFRGAVGERLVTGKPPDIGELTVGVVKLASAAGALKTRDWMHAQALRQPCFSACIFEPSELPISGVATAKAVQQVPNAEVRKEPGPPPPTRYLVEFTQGPYLYFANTDGSRRDARRVVASTRLYYKHVRKLSG